MTGISYGHFAEFSSSFPDADADSTDSSGDEFCLDPEARTCRKDILRASGLGPLLLNKILLTARLDALLRALVRDMSLGAFSSVVPFPAPAGEAATDEGVKLPLEEGELW